ncbi:MAG: N-6 DNA methylase [Candidatus Eisenbacteria bacterium]
MGQHYTQPRVAQAMARWGVRSGEDVILDPACGAGTFLVEAYKRLRELGLDHLDALTQVYGNDIDPFATHLASVNLVTRQIHYGDNYPCVRTGDAFDLRLGVEFLRVSRAGHQDIRISLPQVNVVLGNPPYDDKPHDLPHALSSLDAIWGQGSSPFPRLSSGNLAAWFLLLSAGLLDASTHKRIALLMPVSVLQNDDLAFWRVWLRQRWHVVVWHTEVDVWFSDARVATCVLLLEPKTQGAALDLGRLSFVEEPGHVSGRLFLSGTVPVPSDDAEVRSLDGFPGDADILVAGTKPQVLIDFEQLPRVARAGDLEPSGVVLACGKKLGHDFYKLKDLDLTSNSVTREVEGLGIATRIPVRYLTRLLSSPKQLANGPDPLLETWLLTLPKDLPSNRNVKEYVAHGERQGVNEKKSVKTRGKSWWHMSFRSCRIAVPIHAVFQTPVAWFSEPGVSNNNFHQVEFAATVDDKQQELVAASLASAFGALSALYVSSEVGCEGARWVALFHFKDWRVLNPFLVLDDVAVAETLALYRQFRAIPPEEFDVMSFEATELWTELTERIAALAGASFPQQLADQAVAECKRAVARRKARETAALKGRTRGQRATGGLGARVAKWASASDSFRQAVTDLSVGSAIIQLRSQAELRQGTLLCDSEPRPLSGNDEERLMRLLRPGFECAPVDPDSSPDAWTRLLAELGDIDADVKADLLGTEPGMDKPEARKTWQNLASVASKVLLDELQREVRARL